MGKRLNLFSMDQGQNLGQILTAYRNQQSKLAKEGGDCMGRDWVPSPLELLRHGVNNLGSIPHRTEIPSRGGMGGLNQALPSPHFRWSSSSLRSVTVESLGKLYAKTVHRLKKVNRPGDGIPGRSFRRWDSYSLWRLSKGVPSVALVSRDWRKDRSRLYVFKYREYLLWYKRYFSYRERVKVFHFDFSAGFSKTILLFILLSWIKDKQ